MATATETSCYKVGDIVIAWIDTKTSAEVKAKVMSVYMDTDGIYHYSLRINYNDPPPYCNDYDVMEDEIIN
jgi:hypothetical protein